VTPRHTAIWAALTVGLPSLAIAAWARRGFTRKYMLPTSLPFVVPAALSIGLIGLGLYELQLHWENADVARTSLTAMAIMAGASVIPYAQDSPKDWMTKQGLINDKRTVVLAVVMVLLFWASMLIESLREFYELTPLGIDGLALVVLAYLIWLGVIVGYWRLTAGIAERLFGDGEAD
jgi:hypothetical protein